MNLNSYILLDYLPKPLYYNIKSFYHEFPLNFISLYQPSVPLKQGGVYITDDSRLDTRQLTEEKCLFLCAGIPFDTSQPVLPDLICFGERCSALSLLEIVSDAFRELSDWENEMVHCLIKRTDLTQICRQSVKIFKNSILIHGNDYSILAKAESEEHIFHENYTQEDQNYIVEEVVSDLELSPGFSDTFRTKSPDFFYRDGVLCIYSNIMLDGEFVARITVEGEDCHITHGKRALMIFFTDIVKRYLLFNTYSIYNNLHLFKQHLIYFVEQNGSSSKKRLAATLQKIDWKENDTYFCIVLEPDKVTQHAGDHAYDCLILEKKFFGVIVVPVRNCLLMICNTRICRLSKDELRASLGIIIRERLMKAGYSSVFHDFYLLPDYYQQARAALETGKKHDFMLWQYDFTDYSLRHVLDNGLYALPAQVLIPEGLHSIIDHDREYHSDYYNTLKAYVENDLSASKTSKALFIHISTLHYRLDRLLELLRIDLKKKDNRLYLLLILRLLEPKTPL